MSSEDMRLAQSIFSKMIEQNMNGSSSPSNVPVSMGASVPVSVAANGPAPKLTSQSKKNSVPNNVTMNQQTAATLMENGNLNKYQILQHNMLTDKIPYEFVSAVPCVKVSCQVGHFCFISLISSPSTAAKWECARTTSRMESLFVRVSNTQGPLSELF